MFEYYLDEKDRPKSLVLRGRVDAQSSPKIQKVFDGLIQAGERMILVDFAEVNYVSSAGLRLFLLVQKQLRNAGGELLLFGLASQTLEVFRISGLDKLIHIASTRDELMPSVHEKADHSEATSTRVGEIAFEYIRLPAEKGSLVTVGCQSPFPRAEYTERDVVSVKPADMEFGCGLGTVGEVYADYKDLFGESMIIRRSLFFYPAVKRPQVDFMLASESDVHLTYKFLDGFGFSGPYKFLLSFEGTNGPVELSSLVNAFFEISDANLIGICLLAESKGIWGMRLKQVPIAENRPPNNREIFHSENFSSWVDFPVEPTDSNHIIAGVGIAIRQRDRLRPEIESLIPEGNAFHIHACVFEKGPLSKMVKDFESEVTRVIRELGPIKVQHLLGQSRFGNGLIGIVELQES